MARLAYCPGASRYAKAGGKFAVGASLAVGDAAYFSPNPLLEWRACCPEGRIQEEGELEMAAAGGIGGQGILNAPGEGGVPPELPDADSALP